MNATIKRRLRKQYKQRTQNGGLVYCLRDAEIVFTQGLLDVITELYEDGYSVEDIAYVFDKDSDEIFLALFHQARQGKINRTFAYRKSG